MDRKEIMLVMGEGRVNLHYLDLMIAKDGLFEEYDKECEDEDFMAEYVREEDIR